MPLVAIALASYVAGLLAGFAHSVALGAVGAIAAFIVGARQTRQVGAGLAALSIAGAILAQSVAGADERCIKDAFHRTELAVVLDDDAAPGSFVGGRLVDCEGRAGLSVAEGTAPAGATVRVRGVVLPSQRGVMVQHAQIVAVVHGASLVARWRAAAGRAIDETFGSDAPLVRALVVADRRQLSPAVRDSFAAAGLAHILAIAGLHIGIIAAAVALLLEVLGMARPRAAVVTIVVVVLYVLGIGAPVPAVRSATMLTTLLVSRLLQRPTSRWAIVAIGAAQPTFSPRVVLEVGYQLSVLGVASMIAAGMLCRRIGVHRRPELVKAILVTLIGTTVATVATAPIVAWVFGRVSVIAPLSNLAAAPLIALAQPIVFFGLVASPLHPLAALLADAAHPLLTALTFVATTAAGVPHAAVVVAPTVVAALIAGVMSVAVIVACASKEWTRPAILACVAAVVLVWLPLAPTQTGLLEIHMIDVGQGDAIALRTPHSHWILFDAGRAWTGGDAGRSTIIPYLGRQGAQLDGFVLSHPHTDHVGGAASIVSALHPAFYIDGGFPGSVDAYRQSLAAARSAHTRWSRAHPGDVLFVDGVKVTFLAPDSVWTSALVDPNLASVVARVDFGDVRILMMGDAEKPEEDWLLAHEPDELEADVLKVGHHGSKTSSSSDFLDAVNPRLALVSVGAGNTYGLPTPAVMHAIGAHGAQVLRTDHVGTIVVRTDGHRVTMEAAGDTWDLPPRSPRSSVP